MERKHRKILLKKRLAFVEDLEASDVTGYLYQDGVITSHDKEVIDGLGTRRERVEYLMDLLPRKGPEAYTTFCEVLVKSVQYEHLGTLLQDHQSPSKSTGDCVDAASTRKRFSDMIVRPRSASKREPDMLNSYIMTSHPRGWCFIVNNMHFLTMSDRLGSERDAHNLQALFTALGFQVWLVNDVDTNDIREKVTELVNKNTHTDCLVVCILSHGLAGKIYGVEGKLIAVSEILDIISNGRAAVLLKGKPKLFLIQACRTDEKSLQPKKPKVKVYSSDVISTPPLGTVPVSRNTPSGISINIISKTITSSLHESFIEQNNTHMQSDLLLGYSTFPGEVSWRNVTHGSYFIDSVIEVFREYASSEDVFSMLVKVNQKVLEKVSKRGQEQIPAPVVTLTKKLYLIPV